MNNIDRFQFRRHGIDSGYTTVDGVFETREDAVEYIYRGIKFAEDGLVAEDARYGLALYGEPTILRYKNEEDETDPHVIMAIGAVTNTDGRHSKNRFCIIDIDKTESEIAELYDKIEELAKALSIVTVDSDTLELHTEKTENGTILSGDVKVAESAQFERIHRENDLLVTENGLFIFVGVTYDDNNGIFNFTVNGNTESFKINGNQVIGGEYKPEDESLHIYNKFGDDIKISCENLIAEWVVEGEAANSPIVLKREEVGYGNEAIHNHVEPWQDILSADVRIADDRLNNILKKTSDNRYLYVDGVASNIVYYSNGQKTNVESALNELSKMRVSTDSNNIITSKADGFFASTKLEYLTKENTLVFTTSSNDEDEKKKETRIKLNSFSVFENIVYDASKESLIVTYIDGNGDTKFLTIPIGELLTDWEITVNNYGHSVFLQKTRNVQGSDQLSADVVIGVGNDNILEDINHQLFVRGTADNIKYGTKSTVENEIDKLITKDSIVDDEIAEINGQVAEISGKTDANADAIAAEVERATAKDEEHDAAIERIDKEIGEGFNERNTVRDEIDKEKAERESSDAELEGSIASLTDEVNAKLKDIVNEDHSIDIDKADPTIPKVKVNLSAEVEDGKPNVIKLNNDGLYAGVDLEYFFNEEVGTNQLVFKTTNGTKTFDLKSASVVDKIYYDPTREAIIVEYTINGVRQPDVVIPVGDLINEWRIWDGHEGAVQLEKQRIASGTSEQDVLKASVVISETHEDNILINDNGALYVSGSQIETNKADIALLKERMDAAEDAIDDASSGIEGLSNQIETEVARATAAEQEIANNLANEISRATAKDQELSDKLTAETTRAMSAETSLLTAINNEMTRAANKENEIEAALNREISRSTIADEEMTNSIANEVSRSTAKDEEHDAKIADLERNLASEIDRSTTADEAQRGDIEELQEMLSEIDDEYLLDFTNTNTIVFAKDKQAKGYLVSANVKVNSADDNNIKETANGIYAKVDLTYNETTNRLTFTTTNGSKEIALTSNSIIDKIYYDAVNENIVIEYTVNGQRMDDVIVPVRDLINEIDVADTDTVALIKTPNPSVGSDVITANVKLNTFHEDNILVNDGGLYVSGAQIDANTNKINEIVSAINESTEEFDELSAKVDENASRIAENERLISGLTTSLEAERNRAVEAENGLSEQISNVASGLTSEIVRATNKENEISNNLTADITAEKNRAELAENNLSSSISSETARATTEEARIETKISSEVANEKNRAELAESILSNAVSNEATRAANEEARIETKLDNEIARATDAEQALSDRIDEVDAKTFTVTVEDTTTVDMTIDENNKISSNVVLANANNNIIKATHDSLLGSGLYASVDLEYNAATNKLKLVTSASEREISLSTGSIIKSIEYDPIAKNLVIKFDVNVGGESHEEQVFVPVEDLFNDWTVQEGQHLGAIILHKEDGSGDTPDVLSAEVVISTLEDNMLINDQGSLYVSRRPIDDLSAEVETFKEEYEESLKTTETKTLKLYRDAEKHLMGDVKISEDPINLIKVDNTNEGIIFDGNIDLGTY